MTLAKRFAAFFAAANDGARPYPWQTALVEHVAATGVWPRALHAPTGSGKSSVVEMHVFLLSERARGHAIARPPRRMVLIAPRRVLVDDQHERAVRLQESLDTASEGPLREARDALATLGTADDSAPLGVARLRGGVALGLAWRLDPGQAQIICATPQMWGSRLLLRGFRSSRRARNLEAGLLAHDVVAVIDEAHLHGRLVDTATRIAAMGPGHGTLQLVAMSATQRARGGHGLTDADLEDEALARRVRATKVVRCVATPDWGRDRARVLAQAARDVHGDSTTGVFVNTIRAALDVATQLKSSGDATVRVVCGAMRTADLDRLREAHPGLLDARGAPDVDFLVSTQSLEVGIDLDLGAMVTELAPPSALAQRAGRLNRSGARARSELHVMVPESVGDEEIYAPYSLADMRAGLTWLESLGGDASPERISTVALPVSAPPPVPAITSVELDTLAMTSPHLAADVSVDFYVADPVEREPRTVLVAARRHLDLSPVVVRRALLAAPPRAHEVASLSLTRSASQWLAESGILGGSWVLHTESGDLDARPAPDTKLAPGSVLVVPAGSELCVERIVQFPPPLKSEAFDDVLADRPDGLPDEIIHLGGDDAEAVVGLAEADPVLGTRAARDSLHTITGIRQLRDARLSDVTVAWCWDEEDPEQGLLVIVDSARGSQAPRAVRDDPVLLADHSAAVRQRMQRIVGALDGLVADDADVLLAAAELHDAGKSHPRFQQRMGRHVEPPVAKPLPRHVPDRGDGWRHEQLSAAMARAGGKPPLVSTLIAAHHGSGRPLFDRDHVAVRDGWDACPGGVVDALAELFGPGGVYEIEREMAQRRLGVHRLAFLEAVLRCADMQVSREEQR